MENLTDENLFKQKIAEKPLVFIQFGSETCMPCGALRQKLDSWLSSHEQAAGVYIPVEDFPALAARESVFTVPTICLYAEGKLALRESGYFSLEDLLHSAERYCGFLSE